MYAYVSPIWGAACAPKFEPRLPVMERNALGSRHRPTSLSLKGGSRGSNDSDD
jgi:hypothetical protein